MFPTGYIILYSVFSFFYFLYVCAPVFLLVFKQRHYLRSQPQFFPALFYFSVPLNRPFSVLFFLWDFLLVLKGGLSGSSHLACVLCLSHLRLLWVGKFQCWTVFFHWNSPTDTKGNRDTFYFYFWYISLWVQFVLDLVHWVLLGQLKAIK